MSTDDIDISDYDNTKGLSKTHINSGANRMEMLFGIKNNAQWQVNSIQAGSMNGKAHCQYSGTYIID